MITKKAITDWLASYSDRAVFAIDNDVLQPLTDEGCIDGTKAWLSIGHIQEDDVCGECGQAREHATACSYHEHCPHCGEDACERIGETTDGTPIRHCAGCRREWAHPRSDP